jgi:hypothetical protein
MAHAYCQHQANDIDLQEDWQHDPRVLPRLPKVGGLTRVIVLGHSNSHFTLDKTIRECDVIAANWYVNNSDRIAACFVGHGELSEHTDPDDTPAQGLSQSELMATCPEACILLSPGPIVLVKTLLGIGVWSEIAKKKAAKKPDRLGAKGAASKACQMFEQLQREGAMGR